MGYVTNRITVGDRHKDSKGREWKVVKYLDEHNFPFKVVIVNPPDILEEVADCHVDHWRFNGIAVSVTSPDGLDDFLANPTV